MEARYAPPRLLPMLAFDCPYESLALLVSLWASFETGKFPGVATRRLSIGLVTPKDSVQLMCFLFSLGGLYCSKVDPSRESLHQAISHRCFLHAPASGHASLIFAPKACCGICVVHCLRSIRAGETLSKQWTTHMRLLANIIAQKAAFVIVILTPAVIGNS